MAMTRNVPRSIPYLAQALEAREALPAVDMVFIDYAEWKK